MISQTSSNIQSDIRQMVDEFESAFANDDAAGIASLYTDDAIVLPPGGEIVQGRQNIQQFWQSVMNLGIKKVKLEILEVEQIGDTIIEMGSASLLGEESQVLDKGKYIVIWKQQNSQWRIRRDIFNSNNATPPS